MTHNQLEDVPTFEMTDNIHLRACGSVWSRTHCIPMGGSFSAQICTAVGQYFRGENF